jgi:predicted RNase H-like HicB family nuclease
MEKLAIAAALHKENDVYVAECPGIGTVSQGYTVDEAIANLKEATELYLREFPLAQTLTQTSRRNPAEVRNPRGRNTAMESAQKWQR